MAAITVRFGDHFPSSIVEQLRNSAFMGLCETTKQTGDARVLLLVPTAQEDYVLRQHLEELQREGALAFSEYRADEMSRREPT